jgi:hypothetical protein
VEIQLLALRWRPEYNRRAIKIMPGRFAESTMPKLLPSPRPPVILASAVGSMICIAGYLAWTGKQPPPAPRLPQPPPGMDGMVLPTPFIWAGIKCPPVFPAAEVHLKDDEDVIGVAAGGKHRAYLVSAFRSQMEHVVNDLLGDIPVTVTYCNLNKCHRVFTSEARGIALDICLGGSGGDDLLLMVDKRFYGQKSGNEVLGGIHLFPYPDLEQGTGTVQRTSWGKWRAGHPDTDVYVGVPDDWPVTPPKSPSAR